MDTKLIPTHIRAIPKSHVVTFGVAPEPDRRPARPDEGLLGELLRVVSVADEPKEVGEYRLLMGPVGIFKLHYGLSR